MTTQTETLADADAFARLEDDRESASRYLSTFIDEAEHTLDEFIVALLALEAGGGPEHVKRLFIAAHRIKGSAASIGLHRAAKLAHFMEDMLQSLVDCGRTLAPTIADAVLNCTDGLRQYVDALKNGRSEEDHFDALARQLANARANEESDGNRQPTKLVGAAVERPVAAAVERPVGAAVELPLQTTDQPTLSPALPADLRRRATAALREAERDSTLVGRAVFLPALPQVGLKARLIYEKLSHLGEVRYFDPPADDVELCEQLDAVCFAVVTEESPESLQRLMRVAGLQSIAIEPLAGDCPDFRALTRSGGPKMGLSPSVDTPAPPAQTRRRPSEPAPKPAETLRVDVARLDQLMNLAGQLAIGKARVALIADRLKKADSLALARACVDDLCESIHLLDRVSDGIHQGVIGTRMAPIGPLFARLRRVVRDIARTNGKNVRLAVNGEKTELDKRMIDELADPMIHMIRNAADHGIEPQDVRAAAGKPPQGTISLDAFHRGGNIVIRVSDDGRGLDLDRIRAAAVQRGLVPAADAERMSPQQIHHLVWLPGLSTAEELTEVSGRGVGMDVVRSKIDELNGSIDVESTPGQGTTFTVRLPLTLAILPSLMVEIHGDVFALPLESVVEIARLPRTDLHTVRGLPAACVRDRVVPVRTLDALFQNRPDNCDGLSVAQPPPAVAANSIQPRAAVPHSGMDSATAAEKSGAITLLIIGEGSRRLALPVDRVLGEEDVVIKSIAENYRNVPGIAGASILGDGRVSLILDPPTLIEMSSHSVAAMANA